jgi:DNA-binding transcriptional ArsR family regulator
MLNYSPPLDQIFHALADPTRRALVERLGDRPLAVGELAKPFALSLPAILQHLQILEASGLVKSEKIGRSRICRLEPAALEAVETWVAGRRSHLQRQFDRLGEYLQATSDEDEQPGSPR